jgi:MFS family permease
MRAEHSKLDDAAIERGLGALVMDGVFAQALGVLTGGVLLTGCALAFGASTSFVGLLAAIPLFAQLAQFPAVALIEKLRRRKLICVAATVLARLMLLPLMLVPLIPSPDIARPLLLAAFAVLTPLGAIGGCAWVSWTCDLVPRHRLGEIFARRQLRSNVAGIAAGLLGGAIIDQWAQVAPEQRAGGYVGVFALAVAAALASTWYLTRMPDVPMPPRAPATLRRLLAKPFRDRNFRRLMVFLGGWNLAVNLAVPFFTVYVVRDLHCRITTAVALGIVSQLANVAALPLWGRLTDQCSNKAVIALCAPVFLACIFGWVLAGLPTPHALTLPLLVVLQLVLGAATAGLDLAGGNIALKLAPRDQATAYLGANGVVKALCAGIAPIAGGILADHMTGVGCSFILPWSGTPNGLIGIVQVQQWQIFFLASGALGAVALTRLASIEESGAVGLGTLLAAIRQIAAEKMRGLSVLRDGSPGSAHPALQESESGPAS